MCRWVLYKGDRVYLCDILSHPEHSLVHQALHGRYTPGVESSELYDKEQRKLRDHQVNADGFGVGWFPPGRCTPTVVRDITPPWSHETFHEIAEIAETNLMFGHIRAATPGLPCISVNSHPFRNGRYMWMHNGGIASFGAIKRAIVKLLRDDVYESIQGSTDSEYAFALFMNQLPPQDDPSTDPVLAPSTLSQAMRQTVLQIRQLQKSVGLKEEESYSSLNFAMTDGHTVIAMRCRTNPMEDPPSLYYAYGNDFGSMTKAAKAPIEKRLKKRMSIHAVERSPDCDTLIIGSEPLTYIETVDRAGSWHIIPKDTMIVGHDGKCSTRGRGVSRIEKLSLDLPPWSDVPSSPGVPALKLDYFRPCKEDTDMGRAILPVLQRPAAPARTVVRRSKAATRAMDLLAGTMLGLGAAFLVVAAASRFRAK